MNEKILKAKHWQLFLLTFGIPMIFQFVLMGSIFSSISNGNELNPEMMFKYSKIIPLISILFMGIYFGWFWAVGVGLDYKIPNDLKLKMGRFKFFLIIPMIYMLLILIFFSIFMGTMMTSIIGISPTIFGVIIPLHLFSMFCLFYCLYYVAKTIKTAELQKEVSFADFAGEFFLIWFFPIGIWYIQPKINKIITNY